MDKTQIERLMAEIPGCEVIETHVSWILLGKKLAYKIKKPVKFSFLDFSTLEKRKELCTEEVRLNKRLADDVYIRVVNVVEDKGRVLLEQDGKLLDYAVKMRRIPLDTQMDAMLGKGKVTREHIITIARKIADFHKNINVIADERYGSPKILKAQIGDLGSFMDVIENASGMGKTVRFVLEKCDGFIDQNLILIKSRHKEGKIRDCHGDLHSANIFLPDSKRTIIFDCIEFSKEFRYIDIASEIAFMAMDLDAFGHEEYSNLFVRTYLESCNDPGIMKLLDLYKCYRANVRAKIAAIEYSQHPGEDAKKRIIKYMKLAEKYASGL